jgi:hypothetical protein
VLLRGDDAVDANLEQVVDPGCRENVVGVRARCDDCAAEPRVSYGADVANRSFVHLHALTLDHREHELVLAVAEPVNGYGVGRIVRRALGEVYSARGEEGTDTVVARLAVDVLVVVRHRIEGLEALTGLRRSLSEERVEHLLPGGGMDLRCLRQHTVEIEQAGSYRVG